MEQVDLALIYDVSFGDVLGEEFAKGLEHEKLNLVVHKENVHGEPFMCCEWFLPPLIAAYIAKPYFDSFFKEMGKDHYELLKKKLGNIGSDAIRTKRIEPHFFATEGKLSAHNPFSQTFSIFAESGNGFNFKLLLPKNNQSSDYEKITNEFMEFVHDYHLGMNPYFKIERKDIQSGIVFVHFNEETNNIEIARM